MCIGRREKAGIMECETERDILPKLLVAEDNPSNYKLIEVLLRNHYRLQHAWDGQQAVEMFDRSGADLVLMDINMPVMDGYEAFRRIRLLSPGVPVVALTAFAFEADRQRMFAAGFDDCICKPLRIDELRAKIADFLARKECL